MQVDIGCQLFSAPRLSHQIYHLKTQSDNIRGTLSKIRLGKSGIYMQNDRQLGTTAQVHLDCKLQKRSKLRITIHPPIV